MAGSGDGGSVDDGEQIPDLEADDVFLNVKEECNRGSKLLVTPATQKSEQK